MANPIDVVNKLVQIGKTLRDVAELVKDAETKNLIADLNLALADLKMQLAEIQEEKLELNKRIKTLEAAHDIRAKLQVENDVYWFKETPPTGRAFGPYCPGCFDGSEKLVLLKEAQHHLEKVQGKYACPICKQHFGSLYKR